MSRWDDSVTERLGMTPRRATTAKASVTDQPQKTRGRLIAVSAAHYTRRLRRGQCGVTIGALYNAGVPVGIRENGQGTRSGTLAATRRVEA